MTRKKSTEFQRILKERKEDIPVVCGGEDTEDNLVLVCGRCHSTLTPRSSLTKAGLKNTIKINKKIEICHNISKKFYTECAEVNGEGYPISATEVMDIFDDVIQDVLEEMINIK